MRPSSFSILIFFTLFSLIGFALIPRLSVQWLPTERSSFLSVQFYWSNASPTAIEQAVITPLEGAFNLVQGVESIYSTARNGSGNLRLTLSENVELDYLRFEIAARIRQLYPQLPEGVSFPNIYVHNPESELQDRPILTYALSGTDDPSMMYRYASEVLNPKLALTAGIESIQITGGNEKEWRIIYDEAQLLALQLQPEQIKRAIQQEFASENLGIARIAAREWNVRLKQNGTENIEQRLQDVAIQKVNGQLIRLKDVANLSYTEKPPNQYYRINGQNSIRLLFYAEEGANSLYVAEKVRQETAAVALELPHSYQLRLEDDATLYLVEELNKIAQRTLLSLGILLLFVLLVYRNWRYLLIVLLSLLANLGIAFIFYDLLTVELHLYALAGITVSFGILIDNSIVMMHHLKEQDNLKVFPALLASTLTTLSALSIIWFLPDQWKINLLDFAKVIGINLSVSLVVALFLIPALMQKVRIAQNKRVQSVRLLRRKVKIHQIYYKTLKFLVKRRTWVIAGVVLLFGLPVFLLPNKIENRDWYNKSLGNEWYVEHAKPVVNKLLGGTLRLFLWYVYEGASYREADETVLYVEGSMPPGATMEQMNQVIHQIESYLLQFDVEIKQFTTQVRSGQVGRVEIYFSKGYDLFFPHQLKSRLIAYSLNMGGIKWNIYGVGKGFSNASGGSPPRFQVMMYGYNKEELIQQANRFAKKLLEHPRIQEVNTEANINWWEKDLYEYKLQFDREKLAASGLLPIQLQQTIQKFNQNPISSGRLPNETAFRLIPQDLQRNDLWILNNESQRQDSSKIAFSTFASLQKEKVSGSIHKKDQQFIRLVEFEYTGSARFGSKYLEEVMEIMKKEMPLGYSMKRNTRSFGSEKQQQYRLLLLVIGLVFFVCTLLFESLKQAVTIVLLIPVSFIGIFLTFYLFDFPFDQGGYTSFILLSGIVVNSLILIINDFNQYRKANPKRSSLNLYIKAFQHKITPILLSIISTALGLIPFLIHGQQEVFWFALAVGTIGGLLFSIVVITLLIPVFFVKI